jgi:hypothetical protein
MSATRRLAQNGPDKAPADRLGLLLEGLAEYVLGPVNRSG